MYFSSATLGFRREGILRHRWRRWGLLCLPAPLVQRKRGERRGTRTRIGRCRSRVSGAPRRARRPTPILLRCSLVRARAAAANPRRAFGGGTGQDAKGPDAHVWHSRGCSWRPRSPMVDEALLGEIFGAFGELTTCKIVRDSAGVKGFCEFADYTSAR